MRAFVETDKCFNDTSEGTEIPQIQSYFEHRKQLQKQLRKQCVAETFEFQRSFYLCDYSFNETTWILLVLGYIAAVLPQLIITNISHFQYRCPPQMSLSVFLFYEMILGSMTSTFIWGIYAIHNQYCTRLVNIEPSLLKFKY